MEKACPYCNQGILASSRDHIFPAFLGGHRTVESCKSCNDRFGNSFEGAASRMVREMAISMRTWGLPVRGGEGFWKAGYHHDGQRYDLSSDGVSVALRPKAPPIERDELGHIRAISYLNEAAALHALRAAQAKGRSGKIEKVTHVVPIRNVPFRYQVDESVLQLAAKMCLALTALDGRFTGLDTLLARLAVTAQGAQRVTDLVRPSSEALAPLDAARPALAHMIYVARDEDGTQGIVQLFGVIQIYVRLSDHITPHVVRAAHLAYLDPLEGTESFCPAPPAVKLRMPPVLTPERIVAIGKEWMNKFQSSAIARNATRPPQLVQKL